MASASRIFHAAVFSRCFNPNSPEVRNATTTRSPAATCVATAPPHPMDSSSGCGAITNTFTSGLWAGGRARAEEKNILTTLVVSIILTTTIVGMARKEQKVGRAELEILHFVQDHRPV